MDINNIQIDDVPTTTEELAAYEAKFPKTNKLTLMKKWQLSVKNLWINSLQILRWKKK